MILSHGYWLQLILLSNINNEKHLQSGVLRSIMSKTRKTRIVCISDTHDQTPKLPRGDVLIHAGDLTNQGSYSELKKTVEWLEKQAFNTKIVIAGTETPL
jgi:hypothetical protein